MRTGSAAMNSVNRENLPLTTQDCAPARLTAGGRAMGVRGPLEVR
jgi:hypothetical protein